VGRFATFLGRSPDTATVDDVRRLQTEQRDAGVPAPTAPARGAEPGRGRATAQRDQAALSVAYGAGLRVAEVAALKVTDVDSERMLLRVERGNRGRYRYAILPADLLTLLREWRKVGRQLSVMHAQGWLLPGQNATKPISTRQLRRVVVEAAQAAEITQRVGPHTLIASRSNPRCSTTLRKCSAFSTASRFALSSSET
jgi:site-specific recombinase XerD